MNSKPDNADELIRMSATDVVAGLKKGELSPLDLLDALIDRTEKVEPHVNALPIRFFEEARKEAARFDPRSHENRDRPGFLAGLPVAIKDYNSVAGQLTTYGSPIFAENRAETSDNMVATIQDSGGIAYAKSNVPEIAGANTFNPVFGATRNPWDLRMTVGGSSGGSAASLASGTAWLATGNDLGGSLRIPASYCGIVGLRPSVGRVPRVADLPYDALWVEGPMARNVPDLALMLDAMAHAHPADPLSFEAPARPFVEAVRDPKAPTRIGFTPNLGLSLVDPEVERLCREGVQAFAGAGSTVDETCPDFSGGIDAFQTLRAVLIASLRGELLETERERIAPEIIWNIEKGQNVTADQILAAERSRARIFGAMVKFFETHDILACPTVSVPPYPVEQRFPTRIGDQELTTYIDWMYLTFVITLTGCPAISVPCGFTSDGLPVGLQLIGRPKGDFDLISAAAVLEQSLGLSKQLPIMPKT
ncbi:amidase [Paracoccus halophilus]|uniref:Amidase n=1 Tax=Paracoccus halophilus TaxID=376733 RepID=A0A099F0J7_9RHOB|nr:amidase family protein [Paracoccus halophilus]KGJ03776.1 amidase [Paracoccus halophilus]SFA56784.1 amidase [Paracoccus halophilus]